MKPLAQLVARLRRRPVDPEGAGRRSRADAARRALHDDVKRELGR